MITDWKQAWLAKMAVRRVQEEVDTRFNSVRQIKPLPLWLIM